MHVFLVSKANISHSFLVQFPEPPLYHGQIRIMISLFAFTSNNMKLALVGASIRYWDYFPLDWMQTNVQSNQLEYANEKIITNLDSVKTKFAVNQDFSSQQQFSSKKYGVIPVWGMGIVIESKCDSVNIGKKIFGYFPTASSVILTPIFMTEQDFLDGAVRRKGLPTIYNRYIVTENDPTFLKESDSYQVLLRPLFLTAFFVSDLLLDNNYFGAENVIISSASSKTSYSLAYLLRGSGKNVIGLTTKKNEQFSLSLSYNDVVLYEKIHTLPVVPSLYIDLSGNAKLRDFLKVHLHENLKYISVVGATHVTKSEGFDANVRRRKKAVREEFFFAPAQIIKRKNEWGGNQLKNHMETAWIDFLNFIMSPTCHWLKVVHENKLDGLYEKMLANNLNPAEGHVISLSPKSLL